MPNIYIAYGITPQNELVVASYHNNLAAQMSAATLLGQKTPTTPSKAKKNLILLETALPDDCSQEDIKRELLNLLRQIKGDFNKVTYKGDVNLCSSDKEKMSDFLLNGTLNNFFPGIDIHLILESSNPECVEIAIKEAEIQKLTGAVIQTKSGVEPIISKSYPKTPAPESKGLHVSVQTPHSSSHTSSQTPVADSLVKFGINTPIPKHTPIGNGPRTEKEPGKEQAKKQEDQTDAPSSGLG